MTNLRLRTRREPSIYTRGPYSKTRSITSWPKWAFNTSAILLSNRVLGNAMKLRQWIEGALETAEEVVNKYMGKL